MQNETELVFLNNFLNLIIKEFLLKKKYIVSKVENKIQQQEKKWMLFLTNKLIFKKIYFKIQLDDNSLFFDNSDSNNSNNSNNNNSRIIIIIMIKVENQGGNNNRSIINETNNKLESD